MGSSYVQQSRLTRALWIGPSNKTPIKIFDPVKTEYQYFILYANLFWWKNKYKIPKFHSNSARTALRFSTIACFIPTDFCPTLLPSACHLEFEKKNRNIANLLNTAAAILHLTTKFLSIALYKSTKHERSKIALPSINYHKYYSH